MLEDLFCHTLAQMYLLLFTFKLRTNTQNHAQLRNECLFFWVHGEWIVARNKQIGREPLRGSRDLFVPCYDSFPMNPEKKTLIPYIYNASNEGPFLKFSEKNYKFKIPTVTGS